MAIGFHEVIEEIKQLSIEDKFYLQDWFNKIIIEEKRKQIKKHDKESLKEYKEGKIKFGNVETLRKGLYES